MATWNELFLNEKYRAPIPQPEVHRFIKLLEERFPARPLDIWDFCCGAGRHTVLAASMGHRVYGTDISENGLRCTRQWLDSQGLDAELRQADMTVDPFAGRPFQGAFSWDALHHNTLANISRAGDFIGQNLCSGGLFMASLLSTRAGRADLRGRETERGTYVREDGPEAGVPHHYFDEAGLRDLFRDWKILSLVLIEVDYIANEIPHEMNPFPYTKWNIVAEKA